MKKSVIIQNCYYSCPFFGNSMDGMQCNHPYWEDKEPYANMIITQYNGKYTAPEKCPLRIADLVITYKLKI